MSIAPTGRSAFCFSPLGQEQHMTTTSSPSIPRKVDHSALRTNQAFIIGLVIFAFVLNVWWLVAFVAAVMLVGTVFPSAGLFKAVYFSALKPAGLVKPD